MLSDEDKRDIARRLYDEGTHREHKGGQEAYLDGLWMGLSRSGWRMDEWRALENELWKLFDGLIEGSWE